jgi:hypothetical protein
MPKLVTALKEAQVVNAKPEKAASCRMFDGGGLHLLVTPSGGKLWRMKYRFGGREKSLSFQPCPVRILPGSALLPSAALKRAVSLETSAHADCRR